jgi:uncharacterized membrane protein
VTVVRFLHVAALAFFVGGQLMLVVAVVPALRRDADRTAMRAVARRFGAGSLVALAVLLATGAALADRYERWSDNLLQVKLMVFVLIGVLIALHLASPESRAVAIAVLCASLVTVWLGVALAH